MKYYQKGDVVKRAPQGFSFTVLFFGAAVPVLRGDVVGFLIMLVPLMMFAFMPIPPFGMLIFSLIFAGLYNHAYETMLVGDGFEEMKNHEQKP